MIWPRGEK
jgi:hypothetical protein